MIKLKSFLYILSNLCVFSNKHSSDWSIVPTTANHITTSPRHRVTALVSHLPCPLPPNQSVICLAPCHQTSQSFALPPTTVSPRHRITASLHHRITTSPRHHISQSFALTPATKPVSHLPCPLPPNQSVICLAPCHQTSQSFALPPTTTASPCHRVTSPCHRVTAPPHHRVTALVSHLPCPLSQSVICLAPCHQTSQSFALPPTTVSPPPHHRITALVSHLPCPLPPSQSVICLAPCHQTSQSFALPPTTKPVSHLPCHRVTASPQHRATASLHHRITASPLSVICLAPCHQASQSFALPPATKPVSHLPCHRPCHQLPVSHLPCPLPPSQSVTTNQSVICLAPYHRVLRHRVTASPRHHSHLPCHSHLPPLHHVTASPH